MGRSYFVGRSAFGSPHPRFRTTSRYILLIINDVGSKGRKIPFGSLKVLFMVICFAFRFGCSSGWFSLRLASLFHVKASLVYICDSLEDSTVWPAAIVLPDFLPFLG